MNYRKTIVIVISRFINLTLIFIIFPINFSAAQETASFRFIVTADSRCDDDDHGQNTCTTNSFANEVIFGKVLESIRNHDPAFVVFAGDMVIGRIGAQPVQVQLDAWKDLMAVKGFPLSNTMPAWGGHERDLFTNGVYTAWQNVFDPAGTDPSKYFDPDGDGTANCHYPGTQYGSYGNTVYYCDFQNARFFVLNDDIICDDPTDFNSCEEHELGDGTSEHPGLDQLGWINYYSENDPKELNFFIQHEPAYGTCAHDGDLSGGPTDVSTMDAKPQKRNGYIELIAPYATMIFSDHEHQYHRRSINDSFYSQIDGQPNSAIERRFFEVKAGSSGAPIRGPYHIDHSGNYEASCMDNVESYEAWPDKYYYIVIEVDNSGAQPNVYGTTYAVDAVSGAAEAVDFFAQPDHQVWKIGSPCEREMDWKYYGSNTPPPDDGSDRAWTHPEYVPDPEWLSGCTDDFGYDYNNGLRSGIGYGDEDDCTSIPGMQNTFLNVYTRKTFNLDPAEVGDDPLMTLAVNFDDEFEAFINGVKVGAWPREGGSWGQHEAGSSNTGGGFDVPGGIVTIDWGRKRPPEQYPLDAATVQSAIAGRTEHVLAIKGKNTDINSSDFSLAASLRVVPVSTCEGDFALDGDVDGSDLAVFAKDFGRTDCPTSD